MKKEKAQLKQKVKVTIFLAAMQPKESLMDGAKLTTFFSTHFSEGGHNIPGYISQEVQFQDAF